ncbi:hypothetical protein HF888_15060 [Bermanella marisrubri]|uniref:Uncharacterized protein n=1 Tax=Bermanella marisrubri TaxID=207949 RepID=Q1N2M9_9GAMM|nr:hypothetical protein [Bermanella marisrubri]EAT12378.1 hypothetical protein RED65_16111 [Oceanobacter sp. RED65] [Bermanella marisrubri]QIZ85461.1 hypothetical protein HF888_15060 [Bermanella marisrubri]
MKKRLPLLIMFFVLAAPFAASVVILDDRAGLHPSNSDTRAKGNWLSESHFVTPSQNNHWKLLWRKQDCQPNCDDFVNLMRRLKMATGKYQDSVELESLPSDILKQKSQGIFIADPKGLLLLSYSADDDGAYKALKDIKVLMKHSGV